MEMRLQIWPCGMGQRRSAALERKAIGESDRIYAVTVGGHINWAKDGGTATEKSIRRGQVRTTTGKGCIVLAQAYEILLRIGGVGNG